MLPTVIAMTLHAQAAGAAPIALHPANPHCFLFQGKPTVLITSGEHYGAVLNLDFDFVPYLDELHACGFNLTRTFSGVYMEDAGSFNIRNNTLAPAAGRLICPWARSSTPGYANGGSKFDLAKWDDAYFDRLRRFCHEAERRGIVVELVLFCPYYEDAMWNLSPLNPRNNVNHTPDIPRTEALTLLHPELVGAQDATTRKIVQELAGFPNLYYEICNEPYFGGVTLDWQKHIAAVIAGAEASLPTRHLIAQNIANGSADIADPDPTVSIFNFHYAAPPDAVRANYHLNKAVAFDETGFRGSDDLPYRTEGWDFILAAGSAYSNLDYSFTAAHPSGTADVSAPGGGGPTLRGQLAKLKRFIEGFDFIRMAPDDSAIVGGIPDGATARCLSEPGKQYAIYLKGGIHADLQLDIPPGRYRAGWVSTLTGSVDKAETVDHGGGRVKLASPDYSEDIALSIKRR